MSDQNPFRVYFVMGEVSGDTLGGTIVDAYDQLNISMTPLGLGGSAMEKRGLHSLFDISELSVMGISGVVAKLPNIIKRIRQTVSDILDKKPDVVLLIDSPEFCYRVAKKVRARAPNIKIVKFVAPSVWAWRPGRARKIAPYIDHILAILPFEPDLMSQLGGPETTYVGHPLSAQLPSVKVSDKKIGDHPIKLMVLPGSRRSETSLLMPIIRDTVEVLSERGRYRYELTLPAVGRLIHDIRHEVETWSIVPKVVIGEDEKLHAFSQADVALSASGTVTLELAVNKVPTVSIYKLDRMMMPLRHLITGWTASLPNLIADYPIVPERINEFANPEYIARMIEKLSTDGPERRAQLEGFETVVENMRQDEPSHILAVKKILEVCKK